MNRLSSKDRREAVLMQTVKASGVPAAGEEIFIEATPQQREALARLGNLVAVEKLQAQLTVKLRGKELRVKGTLEADVVYICVLTLETFPHHLSEKIDVNFAQPQTPDKHVDLSFGDDMPEPLLDGRAHIGALVQEFFLLALDPYPHKPDAHFGAEGEISSDNVQQLKC